MSKAFNKWIDTFISEKDIDLEQCFSVEGPTGGNIMPYGVVVEHMKIANDREQSAIKTMLVKIDFANADVRRYLRHLGQAIAR